MNPRIAGRRGQITNLNVDFYHNGVLSDPYAIRRIEIYRDQVLPHNLVATTMLPPPGDQLYPMPLRHPAAGQYVFPWQAPPAAEVPNVYNDVWYYFQDNPQLDNITGGTGTSGTTGGQPGIDSAVYTPLLLSCCHRFWLYPDDWFCDDALQSISFGFEPLQQRFNSPEERFLEVGMMPLPLYDFDYNLVMPMVPFIVGTITVTTRHCELLVSDEPLTIGLRQGSYRTNPFVLRWRLDTSRFLVGTYRYRVTIRLPNGITQTSPWFILSIN